LEETSFLYQLGFFSLEKTEVGKEREEGKKKRN
jgi:hypothetical protein